MENDAQTEIGKLGVELHESQTALKRSKSGIVQKVIILIGSAFWLIFSLAVKLGTAMIVLGIVFVVADGFLLIRAAGTYGKIKSEIADLEMRIAKKAR